MTMYYNAITQIEISRICIAVMIYLYLCTIYKIVLYIVLSCTQYYNIVVVYNMIYLYVIIIVENIILFV